MELVREHTTDISRNLLTGTLKVGCCRASRGVPISSEVIPPKPHRISVLGWSVPIHCLLLSRSGNTKLSTEQGRQFVGRHDDVTGECGVRAAGPTPVSSNCY